MDKEGGTDDFGETPKPLINENPYFIVSSFYSGLSFLENYGWYILFSSIVLLVFWTNVRDSLKKILGQRKRDYSITDDMTPDQQEARMRAMDKARQRMQDRYDLLVQKNAEKIMEQEEQKRLKKISDHDALKSGKSQSGTLEKMEIKSDKSAPSSAIKRNKDAKPLRQNDFNPLTGTSSSSRWRPSSRTTGGG